jgi:hypothetical protein
MIRPFKKTLYNCKEATLLSLKRDEGRISVLERVKLAYHLMHCTPCRRFIGQWQLLEKKQGANDFQVTPPFAMPKDARDRIQQHLDLLKF